MILPETPSTRAPAVELPDGCQARQLASLPSRPSTSLPVSRMPSISSRPDDANLKSGVSCRRTTMAPDAANGNRTAP